VACGEGEALGANVSTKSVSFKITKKLADNKAERALGQTWGQGLSFVLISLALGITAATLVVHFFGQDLRGFQYSFASESEELTPEARSYHKRLELLSEEILRVRRYEAQLKEKVQKVDMAIAEAKRLSANPKAARTAKTSKSAGVGGGDDSAAEEIVNDMLAYGKLFDDRTGDPITRPLYQRLDDLAAKVSHTPIGTPVVGRVTSTYGMRLNPFQRRRWQMHKGFDIVARWRTPVEATADGVVKKARWIGAYGRMVVIDHGNGIETRYAHLSRLEVKQGDRVARGQVVGLLGSTGRSTGAHLHYEVRLAGKAVNPEPFIELKDTLAKL
jgi:murein DD-endopeptidase MepM/ murein hydrolase activator NlpD